MPQLGGILYLAIFIPLAAASLVCLPLCVSCGVFLMNTFCCFLRAPRLRRAQQPTEPPVLGRALGQYAQIKGDDL